MRRFRSLSCLALLSFMLVACEDDFVAEQSITFDVEPESVEPAVNQTMHALLLFSQYFPLFDALDTTEFVPQNLRFGSSDTYELACPRSGSRQFSLSKVLSSIDEDTSLSATDVQYARGDRINAVYDSCELENGVIYNGEMSLQFTELNELNKRLEIVSVEECAYQVRKDVGENFPLIENRGELQLNGTGYFPVDDVRFERLAEGVRYTYVINVLDDDGNITGTEDVSTGIITEPSLLAIRKVQALDETVIPVEYILDPTGTPNLDAESVYRIDFEYRLDEDLVAPGGNRTEEIEATLDTALQSCQRYEADLRATISDLGVYIPGSAAVSLSPTPTSSVVNNTPVAMRIESGVLDLVSSTSDFSNQLYRVEDSTFRVQSYFNASADFIQPGFSFSAADHPFVVAESYTYFDFGLGLALDLSDEAYRLSLVGELQLPGGRLGMRTFADGLSGIFGELPLAGSFIVDGASGESFLLQVEQNPAIRITVDFNGNPDQVAGIDFDYSFITDWQRLLDRDYQCLEITEVDGSERCL